MISVVGDAFPLAVGVALSPVPIMAVLLILPAPAGRAGAVGFLAGRLVGVGLVVAVVALLSELLSELFTGTPESSTTGAVLQILLGLALMAMAIVKWRGRPRDDEAAVPGWMASIDGLSPWGATWLGVIVSVANPKELAFGLGAGLTIGAAGLHPGLTVVAVVIYTVIACSTVIVPVVAVLVAGERMTEPVARAREWMVRNNVAVMSVVMLVIGSILVGEGLQGL